MRYETRQLLPMFVAVAAITFLSTLLVYWFGLRVSWANQVYIANMEAIQELQALLSTLKDAETGQRGYLLTREEPYLEPYRQSVAGVQDELAKLDQLRRSGQLADGDVATIRRLVEERLAEMSRVLDALRDQGPDAAVAIIRMSRGRTVMDELRTATGHVTDQKRTELEQARQRRDNLSRWRTRLSISLAVVNLAFLGWAFRRLLREMSRTEQQKNLLSVTLASIGDAVIVTDHTGRITFLNGEAERLTGWKQDEAAGRPLSEVFRIVNEQTREPVESPVDKVLRLGSVVGLANHTILIARDGREIAIDDSGAPIRCADGRIRGVVLVFRDFSERKKAEAALRQSEERYRALVELSPEAILINRANRYVFANPAALRLFHCESPDQLIGKSPFDLFLPECHEEIRGRLETLFAGKPVPYSNERIKRMDGAVRDVEVAAAPFDDSEGRAVQVILRDVTERRVAEEALHRYELLAANSRDIILFMTREEGRILEANAAAENAYGYSRSELLSMTIADLQAEGGHVLETQMPLVDDRGVLFETRHRRKDGSIFPVEVSSRGALIGGQPTLISIIRDNTARKQAEEALRQSEERLRLALKAAKAGVWDWDVRTGEVVWSPENFELYGLEPKSSSIDYSLWEACLHPDDRESVCRAIQEAVEGRTSEYRVEFRVARSGQPERWVMGIGRLRTAPDADRPRLSGLNIDVTDRKRVEKELEAAKVSAEQAKAAAEEANRAKDQFLAVLSHELRTPLTPVLAAVSMLQRSLHENSNILSTLEMIRRNVEMEARLIDDLLDLTRIARGKVELDKRPVELGTIIEHAAEVCMPDIKAKELEFVAEVSCGTYWVEADAGRLQQVFWNLIKNAVKFTPPGGRVSVRCQPDGDSHVLTEVVDTGDGIAPELLPRLFTAFEQGARDTTRQFGGLGLGLAISKSLVELHGGTIHAQSEGKGAGARFVVRLPLVTGSGQSCAVAPPAPAQQERPGQPESGGLRLLLVEDHEDTAELMGSLLEMEGHRVRTAGSVKDAITLASDDSFDVLISDLGLPDGSGLELIRRLHDQGRFIPAIALSGYGQDQDVRQSRDAGFAAHIVKPVSIEQLLEVVSRVAARRG